MLQWHSVQKPKLMCRVMRGKEACCDASTQYTLVHQKPQATLETESESEHIYLPAGSAPDAILHQQMQFDLGHRQEFATVPLEQRWLTWPHAAEW